MSNPTYNISEQQYSLAFRLRVIWRQISYLSRVLRFYWRSTRPLPVTPYGFKLLGSRAMQNGTFEPEETQLVQRLLSSVDVFFNVGANVGYYCCFALQQGKHVVAFEPVDLNVQHLLTNVRANQWEDHIEVYPVALTNRAGVQEIFGGGTCASTVRGWAGSPDSHRTLVPSLTLDSVLGNRFQGKRCLVVVDIEGGEYGMLQGSGRLLSGNPKPIWMMEVSPIQPVTAKPNSNLLLTFSLFWERGYDAWTACTRPRRILKEEVEQVLATGRNTIETGNILFIEHDVIATLLADDS